MPLVRRAGRTPNPGAVTTCNAPRVLLALPAVAAGQDATAGQRQPATVVARLKPTASDNAIGRASRRR